MGPTLEVRMVSQCTGMGQGARRSPQSQGGEETQSGQALPEGGRAPGVGVQNSEPSSGAEGQLSKGRLASTGPNPPALLPVFLLSVLLGASLPSAEQRGPGLVMGQPGWCHLTQQEMGQRLNGERPHLSKPAEATALPGDHGEEKAFPPLLQARASNLFQSVRRPFSGSK